MWSIWFPDSQSSGEVQQEFVLIWMCEDTCSQFTHSGVSAWGRGKTLDLFVLFHLQAGSKQAHWPNVWAWNMFTHKACPDIIPMKSALRCMCQRGLVETDSPCCERPHCGHYPHFRYGWRGWDKWLCGEWRPWFGHQRSHGASLEEDNNRLR